MAQDVDWAAPIRGVSGKIFSLWRRNHAKKIASVAAWLIGQSSEPIASSRYILILSRPAIRSLVTETNQAGAPAAPWGMQHAKPFVKAGRGLKDSQGDRVQID